MIDATIDNEILGNSSEETGRERRQSAETFSSQDNTAKPPRASWEPLCFVTHFHEVVLLAFAFLNLTPIPPLFRFIILVLCTVYNFVFSRESTVFDKTTTTALRRR